MQESLSWLQRLELKRAAKTFQKARSESSAKIGGVLFVPPVNATHMNDWLYPVRDWLQDRPPWPVRVVIGQQVSTPLHDAIPFVTVEPYTPEQIKRNGSPKRDLKQHMQRMHVDIAILLEPDIHPTSELLYALIPARLKAAVWAEGRDRYSTFLYHPKQRGGLYTHVTSLLEQIELFNGGGLLPAVNKAG
ncbi:hypothetical protein GF324_04230 [bacterium]|nr:hypothetical protein [bacterium]